MVLIVFAALAAVGQILNVLLCLALDQLISPVVGGTAFVLLYMLVFAAAWILTLKIVDREGAVSEAGHVQLNRLRFR